MRQFLLLRHVISTVMCLSVVMGLVCSTVSAQTYKLSKAITPSTVGPGRLAYTTGIVVLPDDSIVVSNGWWLDPGSNHIDTFNKSGDFVRSWGAHGDNVGQLNEPKFLAHDGDGNIVVTNAQSSKVQIFTPNGILIREWGSYGSGNGQFIYPCGVVCTGVGQGKRIFVVDYLNHRIQEFDNNGTYIKSISSFGTGDGQLSHPVGIAVSSNNTLLVTDFSGRVSEFDDAGNFIRVFHRSAVSTQLLGIADMRDAIEKRFVPVVDYAGKRLILLSETGSEVEVLTPPDGGWQEPYNVVVSFNRLIVTDRGASAVYIYDLVDKIAPQTTFAPGLSNWANTDVTATITSTDNTGGSGVKQIHYSINMGTEQIVASSTASFTLSDNGTHSISYFAVDTAGNIESTKVANVKIDKIAPVTTLSQTAGLITLSATDVHSGVAKIKYQINGGAVADYSVPFADTVHKVTYWAEDVAGNIEAAKSDIINAGVQSISVTQARVTGGLGTIGTVTLDKAAGVGGTVVSLASSLPGIAIVDPTITIPEGATSANFDIDANPVAIDTSVSITASNYETSQSALITVQAPMPVQVSWSTSPVVGGTSTTGTLIISGPAPTGGTNVSLASSSLSALVPTTVTIPSGSMTTTFNVSTNVVSNDTSAVISATVYGIKLKSALSILGPKVTSVTLAASSVASLGTTTGTVTLSTNAPVGGKVVTLSSSNSAVANVPVSVTVPAGTKTATFSVTAGSVNTNTNATITASTNGSTGTVSLTVTPPAAVLSTVTTNVSAVTGGVAVTGTVTLTSPAPTGGAVVTLASSSTTIGTVPASVTVAAGATSATFTITTRTVTAASSLTITATRNGVSKTATITVNPVRVVSTLTLNPTSVKGGTNSTGTVTLSGIATEAVVVTLTSGTTTVTRVPATVTVPAGSTTATFTITTLTQTATRTSIITARTGTTSRTATLSVTR